MNVRDATADDAEQLLRLWALLFDEPAVDDSRTWRRNALAWLAAVVDDRRVVRVPVVDVDGVVVASAIGTLELGVPNPHCPRGRTVRLANVVTLPEHRAKGYATRLVTEVVEWAHSIGADRVDLSATADGQRLYERAGFVPTSAPRMKLVLPPG